VLDAQAHRVDDEILACRRVAEGCRLALDLDDDRFHGHARTLHDLNDGAHGFLEGRAMLRNSGPALRETDDISETIKLGGLGHGRSRGVVRGKCYPL
jgi:hypothetical protein